MRILDGRSKMDAESTNSLELAIGSLEPHSQPKIQPKSSKSNENPNSPAPSKPTVHCQRRPTGPKPKSAFCPP
ncbi:hypothetical protein Nepgr_025363 [Nepenthes gracilis]|uniref:Uncharacterized protein n=1 Tax=Nepenthes gracilis TaxID=150966 RepID=A0AAD3Y0Z8_NEPGR|nr:hypothetical protein Nepgr_025363 [Nepenthes gracilis]